MTARGVSRARSQKIPSRSFAASDIIALSQTGSKTSSVFTSLTPGTAASFVSGTEELRGARFHAGGAVAAASVAYLLLSVAMGRAFGTAMGGRSKHRQELADTALPFEATVSPLPARR